MSNLLLEINNLIEEISTLTKVNANIKRTVNTLKHIPLLLNRSNRINTIKTIGREIKPNVKSIVSQGVLGMDYPAITKNIRTIVDRKKVNPVKVAADFIPGHGGVTAATSILSGLNKADKTRQLQARRLIPALN